MSKKYLVIALALFGICSSSQAQESWIHVWWNLYHNGWTGSLDDSWAVTSLREGDSVPNAPGRQYFAFSSSGLVTLNHQADGSWAFWSPGYNSEEELLNAWPTHPYSFFAFDGLGTEDAGTAQAVSGIGFSDQIPSIINPEDLKSITPGEPLEFLVPAWTSPFKTSNSTWLDILDWETRTSVWRSSPGSDSGMSRTFDTTVLESDHEYRLQVIYSARFLSTTESDLLGQTDVLSGFDNRTVYRFTTSSGEQNLLLADALQDLSQPEIITVEQIHHSLSDGVLDVWGPIENPGKILFVWDVDISEHENIRAEFTYRRGGAAPIWESNDWIQLITVDENGGIIEHGTLWNYEPPDLWTVRSNTFSELSRLSDDVIRIGFQARTTSPPEVIQIDSFRVFGTSILPCPADLTGDGVLDFFDVSAFLVFFQLGNEAADFTGDGSFDFFDVSAFLSAFVDGCP
ncbi:MAG: hypothetical protein JKY43_11120 [Phycisphaerales bacterium]|nr:hypothetical protein [Phycisphaerales bacterium]